MPVHWHLAPVTARHKKTKQLETVDTTIKNTQSAYEKIVETSQVLLTVIKKQKRDTKD